VHELLLDIISAPSLKVGGTKSRDFTKMIRQHLKTFCPVDHIWQFTHVVLEMMTII